MVRFGMEGDDLLDNDLEASNAFELRHRTRAQPEERNYRHRNEPVDYNIDTYDRDSFDDGNAYNERIRRRNTDGEVFIERVRFDDNGSSYRRDERSGRNPYERNRSGHIVDYDNDQREYVKTIKRVRRTQSLHRNALQQDVIKNMPSKHDGFTFQSQVDSAYDGSRSHSSHNEDQTVRDIVKEMERNSLLMEDSPDGEALRAETLRDIPQNLNVRRNIKAKLSASVSKKSKRRPIGFWKRMKYRIGFYWNKMKQNIRNILFSMELWYNGIRTVEGHFGSGVAAYFRFLRELFLFNLFISIMLLGLVVIPQAYYSTHNNDRVFESIHFSVVDIFTGQGSFTNTTLHYGFYTPYELLVNGNNYSITNAYFFTMVSLYIFSLIWLSIKVARSYRLNFIENSGDLKNVYSNKIFSGWDFSIATLQAANLKSKTIFNELLELLNEEKPTKKEKFIDDVLYFSIWCLVTCVFAVTTIGSGFAVWALLYDPEPDFTPSDIMNAIRISNDSAIPLAIIVTAIMFALPILYSFLVRFERYKDPRSPLYMTLFRNFSLEATVVGVLIVFWLNSSNVCWETALSQYVYCLVIFDVFVILILLPILEFLRSLLFKFWKQIGPSEFDIARNTFMLMYNQTLLFLGMFYSPLLPAVVTIKMGILYYIKRFTVMRNCIPSGKHWRAAQTQTAFLLCVFSSFVLIFITLIYTILKVETGDCGPFQRYHFMYEVITYGLFEFEDTSIFFTIIGYLTKPGIVAFVLIAMCVSVYYLRAKALAEIAKVSQLRDMLVIQSKDKEFLLNAISKVIEGEWVYNERPESVLNKSNTWKYTKGNENVRTPSNVQYKFEVNSPRQPLSMSADTPSTSQGLIGIPRVYIKT